MHTCTFTQTPTLSSLTPPNPFPNPGTKTQLSILFLTLFLCIDSINPVKLLLVVFPNLTVLHITLTAVFLITYLFISQFRELLYFGVKVFFHSILSIFFSSIETVSLSNVPDGPCIFVGNHANQFVDGIMLMSTSPKPLSFLVAEKSWRRRIIGDFAWAMGAVPVSRPQDKVGELTSLYSFL